MLCKKQLLRDSPEEGCLFKMSQKGCVQLPPGGPGTAGSVCGTGLIPSLLYVTLMLKNTEGTKANHVG